LIGIVNQNLLPVQIKVEVTSNQNDEQYSGAVPNPKRPHPPGGNAGEGGHVPSGNIHGRRADHGMALERRKSVR